MRQIVLDTETTGLEPTQGHRIIEIGCVELINRRITENRYHQYLNPDREIDAGAVEVHGITTDFLADKPRFAHVVDDFINFIRGAELIIHNAPFDVGFINHELKLLGRRQEQKGGETAAHGRRVARLTRATQGAPAAAPPGASRHFCRPGATTLRRVRLPRRWAVLRGAGP